MSSLSQTGDNPFNRSSVMTHTPLQLQSHCSLCDDPDNNNMVRCDNCKSLFHLKCVGGSSVIMSSKNWQCRICRKRKQPITDKTNEVQTSGLIQIRATTAGANDVNEETSQPNKKDGLSNANVSPGGTDGDSKLNEIVKESDAKSIVDETKSVISGRRSHISTKSSIKSRKKATALAKLEELRKMHKNNASPDIPL